MADAPKPPLPWRKVKRRFGKWARPFVAVEWTLELMLYHFRRLALIEVLLLLVQVGTAVAVVWGLISFQGEREQRRKQKQYQAWQVINSAQGKGGNGGRKSALEELHQDSVSLAGIDVTRAVLDGINLSGSNLEYAKFDSASLVGADFRGTNLRGASFRWAILSGAHFNSAMLSRTDFRCAFLDGANLDSVSLNSTDLRGAYLNNAQGWETIQDMELTNLHGIISPPWDSAWQESKHAVSIRSDSIWELIRDRPSDWIPQYGIVRSVRRSQSALGDTTLCGYVNPYRQ